MAIKPITVSQLNDYISRVLITDPLLGNITVQGEISNLKYHSTGHIYFSIIDSTSKINCFLPKEYAEKLKFPLQDGIQVVIIGSVNVFKKNGTYSIYIKNIEISGNGDLSAEFEKLKLKLDGEGLFAKEHKKKIPEFPSCIGVVTSSTGAALQDILKILKIRNQIVNVIIFPVLVQGAFASKDIASTINFINQEFSDEIDTLIVGRGGGSADDLWPFNDESVARSIYNSHIPIISAVGHEIDFTISDMVADLRAETPTAAAQLAVPDTVQLKEKIEFAKEDLLIKLSNKIMYNRLMVDSLKAELNNNINKIISDLKFFIDSQKTIIEENNPRKILHSGYALITDMTGISIQRASQLSLNETYTINFADGCADCMILKIGSDNNEKK